MTGNHAQEYVAEMQLISSHTRMIIMEANKNEQERITRSH